MTAAKNNKDKTIEMAEVLRELIESLAKVVQIPREQRREWTKTLDSMIYD